jgi:glycosyltransferase involved in cell wall biosynthesis
MNSFPRVSVLIPAFNEEPFIAHSLNAVLEQDYPADRLEVIVADGRSTDRTREIVRSFQARHSNIQLIDNPGRIVSTGLNRALASARGDIIVRLDGHCAYPKDYVRSVVALREQTGADRKWHVCVPSRGGRLLFAGRHWRRAEGACRFRQDLRSGHGARRLLAT